MIAVSILATTVMFSTILGDSALFIRDILVTTSVGPSGRLIEPVVNPDGEHTRNLVLTSAPDARWWIIHAEEMARTGQWRMRHTAGDNPPDGREIHWSSLQMWNLVGLGHLLSHTRDRPDLSDIEWAALFVGPITFCVGILAGMTLCMRAFGRPVALAFPVAILAARSLLYFFRGGEADHHGLVAMFAMFGVLLPICGRLGIPASPSTRGSRRGFVAAGILSGAGLWVSAATQIPILVATAVGAVLASWVISRKSPGDLDPAVWRVWGISGALASVGFYLLEYFPGHLGLRLEVNNPVYALAWLAGAEVLSRVVEALKTGKLPLRSGRDWAILGSCFLLIALPAAMIVFGGERFFVISNPFLYALHKYFINEFMSAFAVARTTGAHYALFAYLFTLAALMIGLLAGVAGRTRPRDLALVVFAAGPAAVMTALALHQIRWSGTATAMYLPLIIASFFVLGQQFRGGIRWRLAVAWVILTVAALPACFAAGMRFWDSVEAGDFVDKSAIPSILTRDICHRLAAADPNRRPVVLASPSSSTEIVYYGGAKAIGTLYWENLDGLRVGGAIYSTTDESEAYRLIMQHGITHILLFSWDSFGQRYVRLDRGLGKEDEARNGFVAGLLEGTRAQPTWLNPLYYPIPEQYELGKDQWVRLYEVAPGQSRAKWLYNVAIYQTDAGKTALAMETLRESIRLNGKDPLPQIALMMLMAAEDTVEALDKEVRVVVERLGSEAPGLIRQTADALNRAGQARESQRLLKAIENLP